jgi:hypothetical protein
MRTGRNCNTIYGLVDRARLAELQATFDTMRLLDAVDLIDEIRGRLCDPQELRDELLQLHAMAHTLINGAEVTLSPQEWPIWSRATDLEFEFSEYAGKLGALANLIEQLSKLAPDDPDEEADSLQDE